MKRVLKYIVGGLLLVAGAGFAFMTLYTSDIRPESLRVDVIPQASLDRGRAQLEKLAAAHGHDAWQKRSVMDLTIADEWFGFFANMAIWPEAKQTVRGHFARGNWTSRVELLDGGAKGTQWGIQSWKTWKADAGQQPVFTNDNNVMFSLPTVQYFFELPLRIRTAEIAADAENANWNGKEYQRVYATWGSADPNRKFDQYLLWIEPQSGLLARADYTVRDAGAPFVGTAEYSDYKDIDGVHLPHKIAITAPVPGGEIKPVHTMTLLNAAWDTMPVAELRPDPSLADEGATKPN